MALAKLDAMIHRANTNNLHLISIFIDLENAFPHIWQHHIFQTLHNFGLCGLLPTILQNYLQNRSFCVKVGSTLSQPHSQLNGIPQGSPLSNTLFIVAINKVLSLIPQPFHPILFVDDLSIHLYSSNFARAHRLLQSTIVSISTWLSHHGFRPSSSKSNLMIFYKTKSTSTFPPILLSNAPIPRLHLFKFLGLLFHSSHSWIYHIKSIKAKCLNALNVLKYPAHPSTGCNRKTLLPLYRSLVRSILDYGSPIYGLSPKSHLALLDPIQNSAIRLCTGAFRTSPQLSLCADSGIPPSISVDSPYQQASSPPFYAFQTLTYTISYSALITHVLPTIMLLHPYQPTFNKPSQKHSTFNASCPSSRKPLSGPPYNH